MSFQFNKDQYDKSVNESNFVAEMRKYGLDVATTQIHNSKNQSQVWDESGMTFRMWNEERQDFDPEQIKIINNMMVFTDSGFDDTKMAIGKISLSNGTTAYGINAEVFVGTAIFSQYFTAQNPSGTFKIDDDGLSATNGINTIKIQPNNSGELFSIYKGNSKQLYFTSDGDAVFSGSLKSASGTFSGLISGGSINLGNGTFTVDQNGNMYASSGTFSGTLNGADGNFTGTLYGNEIVGANISGSVFKTTGSDSGFTGTVTIKDGTIEARFSNNAIMYSLSPRSFIVGNNLIEAYSAIFNQIKFANGALVVNEGDIIANENLHINKNLYINGINFDSYIDDINDAYTMAVNAAPKEHSHSKYTTENEVKTIIKRMVKSTALK